MERDGSPPTTPCAPKGDMLGGGPVLSHIVYQSTHPIPDPVLLLSVSTAANSRGVLATEFLSHSGRESEKRLADEEWDQRPRHLLPAWHRLSALGGGEKMRNPEKGGWLKKGRVSHFARLSLSKISNDARLRPEPSRAWTRANDRHSEPNRDNSPTHL